MIKECRDEKQLERLIEYIATDCQKVPYLYLNIVRYGIRNQNVRVWYDEEKEITGVYLLYYDCLHFYAKEPDTYDIQTVLSHIENCEPRVIMLQFEIGDKIYPKLETSHYVEKNHLLNIRGREEQEVVSCEVAKLEDIEEIVDMMMADEEFSYVYKREVLLNQFLERCRDGFGRSFILREEGKIVAVCNTYGEGPGLAVISGLLIDKQHRGKGYAMELEGSLCRLLRLENKKIMACVNYKNTASWNLQTEKFGAKRISALYKFVKK